MAHSEFTARRALVEMNCAVGGMLSLQPKVSLAHGGLVLPPASRFVKKSQLAAGNTLATKQPVQ